MVYFLVTFLLVIIELWYFKVAKKFNIIDKPNLRSSHNTITIRGGGIIFYFAMVFFFIYSGCKYPWFFLGLSMMSIISFLDDIFTLSNKIRLVVHFIGVFLIINQLNLWDLPWSILIIFFIGIVGVINAYNFMDGINGMTAFYSLVVGGLLIISNSNINFIDQRLLIFMVLSVLVFSIFNFRNNAKTFAGDVGSVSIAYIILFGLGLLILKTGNWLYLLFLTVYGIDVFWTIIRRIQLRENIFDAHRSHLYQYLGNEAGINKLKVSLIYGLMQLFIGLLVIHFVKYSIVSQIIFSIIIVFVNSILYLYIKNYVIKRYLFDVKNL